MSASKARIDAEIATLRDLEKSFDPREIARERAEAADRALFDPSKEATLARNYEAAAERGLYRALRELRQVEAEAAEQAESDATTETEKTCEPLTSYLPETEGDAPDAEPDPLPGPKRFVGVARKPSSDEKRVVERAKSPGRHEVEAA